MENIQVNNVLIRCQIYAAQLLFSAWLLLFFGIISSGIAQAQIPENSKCASCHDVSPKMAGGAHSSLTCDTCHDRHETYPHPAGIAKPKCDTCHTQQSSAYALGEHGQQAAKGNAAAPDCETCHSPAHEVQRVHAVNFRKGIPDMCGVCHGVIAETYKKSIHGQDIARGELRAATCTDCHGEHTILRPTNANSPVNAKNIRDTCGQCHSNVALAAKFEIPGDRMTTFDQSFHGLAGQGGSVTVANCASCHGVHNILPSSDAASTVNPKHLAATCGKCHPGAGTKFALGPIHVLPGSAQEPPPMKWVRLFYLLVIPGTIGFMLIHNFGDYFRKLLRYLRGARFARAAYGRGEVRMLGFERLSHVLLAISFIVLAWTGLALKYPNAWWASPLFFGHLELRRNIHRVAAAVMTVVSLMHVFGLLFSTKLRKHWYGLLPAWRDLPDLVKTSLYNVGLLRNKPELPDHSYVAKLEYWAVVWGTLVMVLTGALLWFNNLSLQFLPKWVLDIAVSIHWYEAILASLAIVVWHFYAVMMDPEVYPMDTAWLSGRTVREHSKQESEQHKLEIDAPVPGNVPVPAAGD